MIREFRESDATAVAEIALAVNPHQIETAELIRQRVLQAPAQARRRDWVVELDGAVVAHAHAGFEWSVPTPGKGRFWVGVLPDRRGLGIGAGLYERVDEYLQAEGAWRLRTWVDDDAGAERFLAARGFERVGADRMSDLDPRSVDLSELPALEASCADNGFRLATLAETLGRVRDLFEIAKAGAIDMPSDEPQTAFNFEGWQWDELEHPNLSKEGSFVVLAGERPVSLGFLTVDFERRVAYNQLTATLPAFRRRGLALLVKLASARWAAEQGIERLMTENDAENERMLALNDRLGYRPLYDQTFWALELEGKRPSREGG